MHNQFKKVSVNPQANTIPYASESGHITAWLENDPLILSLQQQNQFIGSIQTCAVGEEQTTLTQFVSTMLSRQPRKGDLVNIMDRGEQWLFTETNWVFYLNFTLNDATYTTKGIVQIGEGLTVENGLITLDYSDVTESRTSILNNTDTEITLAAESNTDYTYTQPLESLTISSIENSNYSTTISFTTDSNFSFSASSITKWFEYDSTPVLLANKQYKITICQGIGKVEVVGKVADNINKLVVMNTLLNPTDNFVTWTLANTFGNVDLVLRVYETATGNTVQVDSNITASTITLKFYAESSVTPGTYTAVFIG